MSTTQSKPELQVFNFSQPQEAREFPHGKLELITLNGVTFGRAHFEPGWRWSKDLRPIAGTASCQAVHLGLLITGRMVIRMDDGREEEVKAGQLVSIPAGHDAWVVGDEPVEFLDVTGFENYARRPQAA